MCFIVVVTLSTAGQIDLVSFETDSGLQESFRRNLLIAVVLP